MDWKSVFGSAAAVLAVSAHLVYIFGILRRDSKPKPVTWGIWGLTDWALLASLTASGATDISKMQFAFALGNTTVAVLSLAKGEFRFTRLNAVCLALSGLAITALLVLRNPEVAILIGLSSKAVGFFPTGVKLWYKESREFLPAWLLWTTANLLNLCAVKEYWSVHALIPMQYSAQCLLVLWLNSKIPKPRS